jgi:hypothetical protein
MFVHRRTTLFNSGLLEYCGATTARHFARSAKKSELILNAIVCANVCRCVQFLRLHHLDCRLHRQRTAFSGRRFGRNTVPIGRSDDKITRRFDGSGECRITVVEGFRACGVRRLIYRYHPNAASRIASVFWRMMRVFSMHWLTREGTQYSGFFQPGHWFSLPKNPG